MKLIIDIPNSLYANLKSIAEGTSACRRILECVKSGHRIEDHKTSDRRIKKIADFYGMESQLDILQEECAELIQAISKYRRGGSYKLSLEEIADVEIMIEQLKYLNTVAENKIIEKIKEGKLDRQIQRIQNLQEAENVKPCSSCAHFNNGNRKPYPCGSCFINSHNMWEAENV